MITRGNYRFFKAPSSEKSHTLAIILLWAGFFAFLYISRSHFFEIKYWGLFFCMIIFTILFFKDVDIFKNILQKLLIFLAIATPIMYVLIDFKYQRNSVFLSDPFYFRPILVFRYIVFEIYILMLFYLVKKSRKPKKQN